MSASEIERILDRLSDIEKIVAKIREERAAERVEWKYLLKFNAWVVGVITAVVTFVVTKYLSS